MALIESRDKINYISISSAAELRKIVPAGTLGAKERTYDDKEKKNPDGTPLKITKIEKYYDSVSGKITNLQFIDTKFGTLLQIELTDTDEFLKGEPEIISMNTSSDFAKDFMKRLPNINLEKEITFSAFSFIPEGKDEKGRLKGVTVKQDGQKIEKSFYETQIIGGTERKVASMGYPVADPKIKDIKSDMKRKEEWKRFFKDCEIFLVDYTTEHFTSKFDPKSIEEKLDENVSSEDDIEDAIEKEFN